MKFKDTIMLKHKIMEISLLFLNLYNVSKSNGQ